MDRYAIPETIVNSLPSPCYIVSISALKENLKTLSFVQKTTGAKVLIALKGFSMFSTFELISQYLSGASSSSLNEAKLASEYFPKENCHVVCPAFKPQDFPEIKNYASHIVFNSFNQWHTYKDQCQDIEVGLRVNPLYSEVKQEVYNPCSTGSRLGITATHFKDQDLTGISGLHFHAMCEQNSDTLKRVLDRFQEQFVDYIPKMKWINFGGGHHITRSDYDLELLCDLIKTFKTCYNVEVYLEPGEAIALNTGLLIATVLDIVETLEGQVAILDASASAHMPDVLEMPYRPMVIHSGMPNEKQNTYTLAGPSCLAGDIIGQYSFDDPLKIGDRLAFTDMAHYTMVKNNTFNGINLPSIATYDSSTEKLTIVKQFGYEDFKNRLS